MTVPSSAQEAAAMSEQVDRTPRERLERLRAHICEHGVADIGCPCPIRHDDVLELVIDLVAEIEALRLERDDLAARLGPLSWFSEAQRLADECQAERVKVDALRSQLAAANDSVAKAREVMARDHNYEIRSIQAMEEDLEASLADAANALEGQGSEVVMVSYSRCTCCGRQTPHEFCHDCSQAGYACHPNGWGEEPAAEVCGLSDEACPSLRTVGA